MPPPANFFGIAGRQSVLPQKVEKPVKLFFATGRSYGLDPGEQAIFFEIMTENLCCHKKHNRGQNRFLRRAGFIR
jgi:hypothetical protein